MVGDELMSDQSSDSLSASRPQSSEEAPMEAGHVERAVSDHKLISREEAIAQGTRFFFTGKPCYYGHIARRYIVRTTSICSECSRINQMIQDDKRKEARLVPATEEELAELRKRGHARAIARAMGLKYFYSDKPCKRGHTERRLVQNGSCVQCLYEHGKAGPPHPRPELPYIKPTWIDGKRVALPKLKLVKLTPPPKPPKPPKVPKAQPATTTELTKWLLQRRADKAEFDKRWAEHVAAKQARIDARLGEQA
jgi:hypothetical protein